MNIKIAPQKLFAWFFLSTGVFAIIGALYSWGQGPIYQQKDLLIVLVPWADLLITGPLSLLAAFGVAKNKSWGPILGILVCGIYLFGSALVYISLIWQGPPYPLALALPPLPGITFAILYPLSVLKNPGWISASTMVDQPHRIKKSAGVRLARLIKALHTEKQRLSR